MKKMLGYILLAAPFVGVFVVGSYFLGAFATFIIHICCAIVIAMICFGNKLITENKKDKNLSDR